MNYIEVPSNALHYISACSHARRRQGKQYSLNGYNTCKSILIAVIGAARIQMKTFTGQFCARYGVQAKDYERKVLQLTLRKRARLLAPLLRLFNSEYFVCDYSFIRRVGELRRREDLTDEILHFYWHPLNRGFLRRTLRLRVSAVRMRKLFQAVMGDGNQG